MACRSCGAALRLSVNLRQGERVLKISDVRIREVVGRVVSRGPSHREPIGRPVDVLDDRRPLAARGAAPVVEERRQTLRQMFVRVVADDGTFGDLGPVRPEVACVVGMTLRAILVGQEALATERVWDLMYRSQAHGRSGIGMQAISAVDCALWDLKGKHLGQPVYRLLGGPTRSAVQCYAQTKGLSHHPDHFLPAARELVEAGWRRIKVFLNHGPADGRAGMARNAELIRSLRQGLPADVELMADAWRSWDPHYAAQMLPLLEPHQLAWLEEPLRPEFSTAYHALRQQTCVPFGRGEHEYTRWGHAALLARRGVDVLQPDVTWAGGITETLKIAAIASAEGVSICPHTNLLHPTVHLLAALSPGEAPLLEYPVFADTFPAVAFLKEPLTARAGVLKVPTGPGLGMELDEGKIESQRDVTVHWEALP